MNAQDLEQRARELLAAEYERDGKTGSAEHIRTKPLLPNKARAVRAIVAALRQQPAPVVDDARMARALEWVRGLVKLNRWMLAPVHAAAIEEAIAAYDPSCGGRTVRVVDDADATEILALSLDEFGYHTEAKNVRAGEDLDEYRTEMWAIRAALARAQGVRS